MNGGSYALLALGDQSRPQILMLLDEQQEADAIAAELRKRGTMVVVRFLTAAQLEAEEPIDESQTSRD